MPKLTNLIKEEIVANAIMKSHVPASEKEILLQFADWAERARVEVLGGPKMIAKIAALDKEFHEKAKEITSSAIPNRVITKKSWFSSSPYISLNLGGKHIYMYFDGRHFNNNTNIEPRVVPDERVALKSNSPLISEFYTLDKKRNQISKDRSDIRTKVMGILSCATTIKNLLDMWPEAVELLPKTTVKPNTLPSIQTQDVNRLLKLPTV